ncbi:MAG TPA: sigma-54 dependent transcriptional regulator [Terriglobia bacterium]|nr:sigma-54 dependent transcriptional regulator [Terriglobia bacterium]
MGRSSKIQEVAGIIDRVAAVDIPVLITGESGTGKEVVARLLHQKSPRQAHPFWKINCAAIPHELLESELFGFERGSFTQAFHSKPGTFELADKGTVYLDEISGMSLRLQPKLLQVLQDAHFSRLGGRDEIAVDVRLISSSNQPMDRLLSEGRFREDLYYRLSVVSIHLPPLRERKEDIPELVQHMLRKYANGSRPAPAQLPDHVMETLVRYDWPGNIRELENAVRKFLAVGLESAALDDILMAGAEERTEALESSEDPFPMISLKEAARIAARKAERDMILLALRKTNWNRKRAAELLKISYKAMLYKLKAADLTARSRSGEARVPAERL